MNVSEIVEEYLNTCPPALELYNKLKQAGNIYLIGGVLREILDNDGIKELRDIDVIIDCDDNQYDAIISQYNTRSNAFGGLKVQCQNLIFDVWQLNSTWAYKNNAIQCSCDEYVSRLPETVFLNIDGIVYDIVNDRWNKSIYDEAVRTNVLDVVLADNPYIDLNVVRAMVIRQRYSMTYSARLRDIIQHNMRESYDKELYNIELQRYGREILTLEDIQKELELLTQ